MLERLLYTEFPSGNRTSVAKVHDPWLDKINISRAVCICRCAMEKWGKDEYSSTWKPSYLNSLYRIGALYTLLKSKKGKLQGNNSQSLSHYEFSLLFWNAFPRGLQFLKAHCQSSGSRLSNAGFPTLFKVLYNSQLEIELKKLTRDTTGEGNGTPLQYFCLENPMDRGAW